MSKHTCFQEWTVSPLPALLHVHLLDRLQPELQRRKLQRQAGRVCGDHGRRPAPLQPPRQRVHEERRHARRVEVQRREDAVVAGEECLAHLEMVRHMLQVSMPLLGGAHHQADVMPELSAVQSVLHQRCPPAGHAACSCDPAGRGAPAPLALPALQQPIISIAVCTAGLANPKCNPLEHWASQGHRQASAHAEAMDTRLERPRPQRRRMQQSVCSKLTGAGCHRAALIYLQNASSLQAFASVSPCEKQAKTTLTTWTARYQCSAA